MAANPCGRVVTREYAYEVYQSPDGEWTYFVLKKYQAPEREAKNPYARWLCNVVSPATSPGGDTGDIYVSEVKRGTRKLDHNPLTGKPLDTQAGGEQ